MMQINLIQLRHNYAPRFEEGHGHIYMPTSLFTAAARIITAGNGSIEVILHDENFREASIQSQYVGINLLGAPYIPEAIKLQNKLRQRDITYLIGGQVISGLNSSEFSRLFGDSAFNGNDDSELSQLLGINRKSFLPAEKISLIPAYEKISDEDMKEYLSREFSLYISQGCKFSCDFCAAVRTTKDPITGELLKIKEVYREIEIIAKDLDYLAARAKRLGINHLEIYMSNLDVFQNPSMLKRFSEAAIDIKNKNKVEIKLRALSTVDSFINTRDEFPETIEKIIEAGLHTVGFGVDGMTPQVWKALKKGHNTEAKCIEAIRSCDEIGITPEILMVFGHYGVDTERTLKLAYEFTIDMIQKYNAVPRPHVAKNFIPGNKGWTDPCNSEPINLLIRNPELFQSLDFTCLPSGITHPNEELKELATKYYLMICELKECTTLYAKPIDVGMNAEEIEAVQDFNLGRYDH